VARNRQEKQKQNMESRLEFRLVRVTASFMDQGRCWKDPDTSSTKPTFRKYSADSALTDFLPCRQMWSSMSLPVNTSGCHLKALTMAPYKVQINKIGQYHKKSGYSIFPWLCQILLFFIHRYSEITVPLMCLTCKVPLAFL